MKLYQISFSPLMLRGIRSRENKNIKYLVVRKMKRRYYFTYQQNNVSLSSLTSRIKKEHIPLPLVSVLEVIGLKLTIKLLKTYQGKRFYIPVRNYDNSKLNEVLPQDAVRELSSAMGGMRIDLRHTSIKGVYDTVYFESLKQKHKESKMSINQFCRAYNLTLSDRKKNKLLKYE